MSRIILTIVVDSDDATHAAGQRAASEALTALAVPGLHPMSARARIIGDRATSADRTYTYRGGVVEPLNRHAEGVARGAH